MAVVDPSPNYTGRRRRRSSNSPPADIKESRSLRCGVARFPRSIRAPSLRHRDLFVACMWWFSQLDTAPSSTPMKSHQLTHLLLFCSIVRVSFVFLTRRGAVAYAHFIETSKKKKDKWGSQLRWDSEARAQSFSLLSPDLLGKDRLIFAASTRIHSRDWRLRREAGREERPCISPHGCKSGG